MSKDTPRSHTPPGEGMRRLISDILATTIPEEAAESRRQLSPLTRPRSRASFAPATSGSRKTLTEQSQKRSARPGRFPMTSSWDPTGSSSAAPTATLVPGTAQPAQPQATKPPTSSAFRSPSPRSSAQRAGRASLTNANSALKSRPTFSGCPLTRHLMKSDPSAIASQATC